MSDPASTDPVEALATAIVTHPFTDKAKVNFAQVLAISVYGAGDYAGLLNMPMDWDEMKIKLSRVGDTLFQALILELSTQEDCEDLETACRRVRTMIDDLAVVATALEVAEQSLPKPAVSEDDKLLAALREGETPESLKEAGLECLAEKKPELNNPEN